MRKKLLVLPFIILCCCLVINTSALCQYTIVRNYTTADGLPSNHIYKCLQDKKGFLWVATENGLSRFDGQRFTNFTMKDGLPDNDILDIFMDTTGNIWMTPFSKNPAYFNSQNNQIINATKAPDLAKITGSSILIGRPLSNGKVVFYDANGKVFVLQNKKLIASYDFPGPTFFYDENEQHATMLEGNFFKFYNKGVLQKSTAYKMGPLNFVRTAEEGDQLLFIRSDSSILSISGISNDKEPVIFLKRQPFRTWNIAFLKNYIGAAAHDGNLNLLDKKTLEVIKKIPLNASVKNVMEDNKGNIWISTDDKGIIKLSDPKIKTQVDIENNLNNVQTFYVDSTNILAGMATGYLIEINRITNAYKKFELEKGNYNNFFIKKFIPTKKGTYIITLKGLFLKSDNGIYKMNGLLGLKDGILKNDSTLLLGSFRDIIQYNIHSGNHSIIAKQRVSSMAADASGNIYIGSNEGLFKLSKNELRFLGKEEASMSSNVTKLFVTPDNIVWAGLSSDTVLAIRDDKILKKIPLSDLTDGAVCKSLASNQPGIIWVGTDRSLLKINYTLNGNTFNYTSVPFNVMDGLTNGEVTDISFSGDSIFVATTSGICRFEKNLKPKIDEIPVYLTQLLVNAGIVPITDALTLSPSENNIDISFSGVELSGYKPTFEYKINEKDWRKITGNNITLSSLAPGKYDLRIRAIKKDNLPSAYNASLKININAPLWRKPWFLITLLFSVLIIFILLKNKNKLAKQNRLLQQQIALDNQRQKITADLHDDIGASLSSLQVNSAVANQLMIKNPEEAQRILSTIENQSKKISEKIGDIIWSMKPGKDEFMSLSTRIKTFASDILGATTIDYAVHMEQEVNTAVTDFTMRKNIVLIVKEAINNAVKYSQAKKIIIDVFIINKTLTISIVDDGIGIAPDVQPGNGLANMNKRAIEMKGVFTIHRGIKNGTLIKCEIPV